MKKLILTIFFLPLYLLLFSQNKIMCKVVDFQTNQPIVGVSVFLSNTSIGGESNTLGEVLLQNIPNGRYNLIASSFNYEEYTNSIQSSINTITIKLKPSANLLKDVIVESYETDGWEKYGIYFVNNFIGNSSLSQNCKLTNPEVVKFKLNSKTNVLRAFAHEKLIFENRSLGYKIIYMLNKFEYNLDNNTFKFAGSPLFEELKYGNEIQKHKWDSVRKTIYLGSLMHFMRSLYADNMTQDGFELKPMIKISDEEKRRVKKSYRNNIIPTNNDSTNYYSKVLKLRDEEDTIVLNKVILRDSIVFPIDKSVDPNALLLEFENFIHITYLKKKEPVDYTRFLAKRPGKEFISTDITLPFGEGVKVYSNGMFYVGDNLFANGFWAWSEKLSSMLPYDYSPN